MHRSLSIFDYRWAVPLMADLYVHRGAKFVSLEVRLGLSGSILAATLDRLTAAGWVKRNPGHGHPLRPEYVLTRIGRKIGEFCQAVLGVLGPRRRFLLETRWALPVVLLLTARDRSFAELKRALQNITPRALSLELKRLIHHAIVRRSVAADFPPRTTYRAVKLVECLNDIQRRHSRALHLCCPWVRRRTAPGHPSRVAERCR